MKHITKNVKIGLTMLVGLILLYWGVNYLKGINLLTPANYYYTEVADANGLLVATPVTVNGYQVGQVREIKYDYKKNNISIMLMMDKELSVPEGSSLSMENGLLGGTTLVLHLGNGPAIATGSVIPTTELPGLMDKVTDNVLPMVGNILPKVDSIMGNVNGITSDPALLAALARLDGITRQLQASAGQLAILMSGLNRSVPGLMNNVDGITGNLNGASNNLTALTASLKQMPLDSTVRALNATLANLQALSEQLNDKNSSLGKVINDRELYDNANRAIASLDSLLIDVKANPKRYINVKVF